MKLSRVFRLFCILAGLAPAAPGFGQTAFDGGFNYFARDNVADNDNDVVRITVGATWELDDGGVRGALAFGARKDFAAGGGVDALDFQAEALRYRDSGAWRYGAGVRIGTVTGEAVGGELLLAAQRFGGFWAARGMIGAQAITGAGPFTDGRNFAPVGLAEFSLYPVDWAAVRTGLFADDTDIAGTLGVELAPFNSPVSLYADWILAADGYRGDAYYNDLVFGVRFTQSFGGSLKERERRLPVRMIYRPTDIQ